MKGCHPKLLEKLVDLGQKLEERDANKKQDGKKTCKQYFKDAWNKLLNMFGKVKDQELTQALEELRGILPKERSHEQSDQSKINEDHIHKTLGNFTAKINREDRSGQRQH